MEYMNDSRVFILGAGASVHAGLPTGDNILKAYIEQHSDDLLKEHTVLENILSLQPKRQIDGNTKLSDLKNNSYFPTITDVFTMYDLANERQERLVIGMPEENNILREEVLWITKKVIKDSIKQDKKEIIKNDTTDVYRSFSKKLNVEDTIINFNYDTLLDNAIKLEFAELNYNLPLKISSKVMSEDNLILGGNSPQIIKPHGSFNWLLCPDCYDMYYKLSVGSTHTPTIPDQCESCDGELGEFIIPLTYYKKFNNPLVTNSWNDFVNKISKASEVYLIGYSLPDDDFMTKYFLLKGLHAGISTQKIKIVNPNDDEKVDLSEKFNRLFGHVKIIEGDYGKFENFVEIL